MEDTRRQARQQDQQAPPSSWRDTHGNLRRIRENALVMRRDAEAAGIRTAVLRAADERRRRECCR